MPRLDPRVLEVYAQHENSKTFRSGTGYLLDDGLVLTAAHVIRGEPDTPIEVRFPGDARPLSCSLAWRRYEPMNNGDVDRGGHARFDAALLRIEEPFWIEPRGLTPLRWGRLVTDLRAVPAILTGFPTGMDARDDRVHFRDSVHGSGHIDTHASPDGHLRLTLSHPIPTRPNIQSRWRGASGAAVLVSGLLTGIAVTAEKEPAGLWVELLPTTELAADPAFQTLIGSIDFEPAELRPLLGGDAPRQAHSPVSLLVAEAEAVRFHGRDNMIEDLSNWCSSNGAFSVRLITGQGGQGKTRLARHLSTVQRESGWSVGFLTDPIDENRVAVIGQVTAPLLLVVDYAEDRGDQLVTLSSVLHTMISTTSTAKVRLLLLTRATGDWWNNLRNTTHLFRGLPAEVEVPLPVLEPDPTERSNRLQEAVEDLASRLGEVASYQEFDRAKVHNVVLPNVSSDRFSCALNLHMAGLVALLQAVDPVKVRHGEDNEAILLRHEQKFWKRTAEGYRLGNLDLTSRRRLVGAATLCQADSPAEAHAVLDRLGVTAANDPGFPHRVGDWLASLYPAENAYWGPVQPDRVGEYLISIVIDRSPDLLERLLPDATRSQALRALRKLARADLHRPGTAATLRTLITRHAEPLAFTAVVAATTVEHPEPLRHALDALTHDETTDTSLLSKLYDSTPLQTQALSLWATRLAERLVVDATIASDGTSPDDLRSLAKHLNNYAIRKAAAGEHPEALELSGKSVAIRRRLATNRAVADLNRLALSLNTHTNSLSDSGQHGDALPFAEEVVRLSQKTVAIDPEGPAMAHYSLSIRQNALGQLTEAVETAEEALRLYRDLARDDLAKYRSDVALALDNYAIQLTDAGLYPLAVTASSEAVTLYRQLAAESPDAHLDDLARALSTSAYGLNTIRQYALALQEAQESVRLCRELADLQPGKESERLAEALTIEATCLSDADDAGSVLPVRDEALTIYRRLHDSAPESYLPQYTQALCNKAAALQDAERESEAKSLYDEALPLYRKLTKASPEAHSADLADVLANFVDCMLTLNDQSRALELADEAVFLSRRALERERQPHLTTMVRSLLSQVNALRALERTSPALRALDEAISLQYLLADHDSDVELPTLTGMLQDRVELLSTAGKRAASAIAAGAHVTAARRLEQLDAEAYGLELTNALTSHAITLREADSDDMSSVVEELLGRCRAAFIDESHHARQHLGTALRLWGVSLRRSQRLSEALEAAEENVRLFEDPAEDDPETHLSMLVGALADQASSLMEASQANSALIVSTRALKYRTSENEPNPDFAEALITQARAFSALGRHNESLMSADEALLIWREMADATPEVHRPDLASTLRIHADLLVAAELYAEAAVVADEAVTIFSELASKEADAFESHLARALGTQRKIPDDR